jgi:hypothetical protein
MRLLHPGMAWRLGRGSLRRQMEDEDANFVRDGGVAHHIDQHRVEVEGDAG